MVEKRLKKRFYSQLLGIILIVSISVLLLFIYRDAIMAHSTEESDESLSMVIDFGSRIPDSWPNEDRTWIYQNNTLQFSDSENSSHTFYRILDFQFEKTPFDLLLNISSQIGFEIDFEMYINGAFVTSIDGVENGPGNAGWTYYVNEHPQNGTLIPLAADLYSLSPGDTIYWYFSE